MAAAAKYYAEKEFGESMNTHKEEKLGRVVVTQGEYKGLEGFACDYDPKKGTYNVDFNTGRTGPFHRIELAPLEPTPPSQIEEESYFGQSLREMYELGKEHGRTLALKDMEIEKLIKEIKGE